MVLLELLRLLSLSEIVLLQLVTFFMFLQISG